MAGPVTIVVMTNRSGEIICSTPDFPEADRIKYATRASHQVVDITADQYDRILDVARVVGRASEEYRQLMREVLGAYLPGLANEQDVNEEDLDTGPPQEHLLHIYTQPFWHSEAFLVGNRAGLLRVRQAIDDALTSPRGLGQTPDGSGCVMTGDGEGYRLIVIRTDADATWVRLALPYTDDAAAEKRPGALSPGDLHLERVAEPGKAQSS